MRTLFCGLAVIGLLATVRLPAAGQGTLSYRDRTGDHETGILMDEETIPGGSFVHSRMTDGDRHDVEMDAAAATIRYRVQSPQRRIDYTVIREGNELVIQGTLGGAPIEKRITIDARPWYQAVETSLVAFVRGGGEGRPEYWTVNPWDGNAYLLRAESEGEQVITVNGRMLTALRVRMRPLGILRLFWSALYWYRPSDGRFLRYEAVRGLPGTPLTVVEYMGND